MSSEDLCLRPMSEQSALLRSRELSPVELLDHYLARIDALDGDLNSYIALAGERARRQAQQCERDLGQDLARSPLHGIPIAFKDIVDVATLPTTGGSGLLEDNTPTQSGTVVDRLELAGAITLGKLNMNEFATLIPSERFGPTRNPWSASHSPGGSSSGSGVAVAAGLCAGALGTDTGGSIRIPASFNGIVGLKATHGRVSNCGVLPLAWSLDHIGPMTRTVKDAAMMMDVIAAYDAKDVCSQEVPPAEHTRDIDGGIKGLRIGVPIDFFSAWTEPAVAAALTEARLVFTELGAELVDVELPPVAGAWDIASRIISGEASTWHAKHLEANPTRYGSKVRRFLERASGVRVTEYVAAMREKAALARALITATAAVDALLVPGTLIAPPLVEARSVQVGGLEVGLAEALVSATVPFNLSGQPALSVPAGYSPEGLPVSLQLVGQPFCEPTLLRIGHAYERECRWPRFGEAA